jgi:DUF1680 family protein
MERVFYNTVLGAKPLQSDGRAFYYSDYNSSGSKVYFPDAWPCCSGTLPQVAADYRMLTYFRDAGGVFVNLYLPSTLRWTNTDGAQLVLTQTGDYPFEGKVSMYLRAFRPSNFGLRLRIPAWSSQVGPLIRINGEPASAPVQTGFANLQRTWKDGDRVELELALPLRVEAIDPNHPETVALLRGPLVLFAIADRPPAVTRQELLSAIQLSGQTTTWTAKTASGPLLLRPFSSINDERYSTYLNVG